MVETVLSGASMEDVQLANMADERGHVLDRLAMRPGYDTGNNLTGTDIIRMKYPGPEGERWARYWETRFD